MTLYDGHLLNNWSTSKVVKFDEKDVRGENMDEVKESARAAIRAVDTGDYLRERDLYVRAVYECSLL